MYKVVPFKGIRTKKIDNIAVSKQLEDLINEYDRQGYDFVETATIDIMIPVGCLGKLLGQREV